MAINPNDPGLLKQQAFLNGQWVDADQGDSFEVINPAAGESISVASMGADETAGQLMQPVRRWRCGLTSRPKSARLFCKVVSIDSLNLDDLALILTMEQGKVLNEARGEVTYGAPL